MLPNQFVGITIRRIGRQIKQLRLSVLALDERRGFFGDMGRSATLLQRCWRVGILREFGAKGFRFSCRERIMPFKLHSKSRRHILRQCLRVTNRREYDASLRNRGSLPVWFTPEAIAGWKAQPRTTPGGQRHYSDLAIQTAPTLPAHTKDDDLSVEMAALEQFINAQHQGLFRRRGRRLCPASTVCTRTADTGRGNLASVVSPHRKLPGCRSQS
jgi:hypothetical protein